MYKFLSHVNLAGEALTQSLNNRMSDSDVCTLFPKTKQQLVDVLSDGSLYTKTDKETSHHE